MDPVELLSIAFGGFGVAFVSWALSQYNKRRARIHSEHKQKESRRETEVKLHIDTLRTETKVLYPAIVRCVRDGATTGDAEIGNVTIQRVSDALDGLQASKLLTWYPSHPDLTMNTINRIFFTITNPKRLRKLLKEETRHKR